MAEKVFSIRIDEKYVKMLRECAEETGMSQGSILEWCIAKGCVQLHKKLSKVLKSSTLVGLLAIALAMLAGCGRELAGQVVPPFGSPSGGGALPASTAELSPQSAPTPQPPVWICYASSASGLFSAQASDPDTAAKAALGICQNAAQMPSTCSGAGCRRVQ